MPTDPIPDWVLQLRYQIGRKVFDLRMAQGWNQDVLAERSGVERGTISSIENGTHATRIDHLALVADALGVHVRHLFE